VCVCVCVFVCISKDMFDVIHVSSNPWNYPKIYFLSGNVRSLGPILNSKLFSRFFVSMMELYQLHAINSFLVTNESGRICNMT
jgi:hypothetical protein